MSLDLSTILSPTQLPLCPDERPWQVAIKFITAVTLLAAAFVLHSGRANAQSMEPRAYSNAPVGMNFLILGYVYQKGNVLLDPSVPVKDVSIEAHTAVAAYARSIDVFGKSGKFDIIVPYSSLSGSGTVGEEEHKRSMSGFADPAVRLSVNLYGAPALSLEEFKEYRQDTILGVSFMTTMPLGQYDSDKVANIGSNRWSFKPEVGVSQALWSWTVEAIGGVTFFTENDDYFGNHKREQDPIYSMQGHLIYNFQSGIWAALNATYYTGGRTAIDGVQGDDEQSNWRAGATLTFPIDIHNSIKLYGSTAVQTRVGGDFDLVGIAWQYRWGAGL
jgi:hypothetical protein